MKAMTSPGILVSRQSFSNFLTGGSQKCLAVETCHFFKNLFTAMHSALTFTARQNL
jgi:hypothetical protein